MSAFSISDDDSLQTVAGVVELVTRGAEALCVVAPHTSALNLLHQQVSELPTVVITAEANPSCPTVGVDQRQGAHLAVQHLIDLGHTAIAHLAGPLEEFDAHERAEGWRTCLAQADVTEGPLLVGDWSSDFGFDFSRSHTPRDATAIFAANDQMALGVIHGLHHRGVRVPEDVSVVGYDDMPDARHLLPPLITVRPNHGALGQAALRRIIVAIQGNAEPTHQMTQPRLTVRESTKATVATNPL